MTAQDLASLIYYHRHPFHDELRLQDSLQILLEQKNIPFIREHVLNKEDRIDFLVGSIGVEVKVASPKDAVQRQLWRYAKSEEVTDLILVTTKSSHKGIATEILGKPVLVVHLINSFL